MYTLSGSETVKLEARLALTGRYQVQLPRSSEELRWLEAEHGRVSAAAATTCNGQPDFKTNPPGPILLKDTLAMLIFIATKVHLVASPNTTLAQVVQLVMDARKRGHENTHRMQAHLSCPKPEAKKTSRQASGVKAPEQLVFSLMQQSYRSSHRTDVCRKIRSLHMITAELEQRHGSRNLVSRITPATATDDASALVASGDFLPLLLVPDSQRHDGSTEQCFSQKACTTDFLRIRMLLRCEPFFVRCYGAAHIGAFLQLAKRTELHLELLPSRGHMRHILE